MKHSSSTSSSNCSIGWRSYFWVTIVTGLADVVLSAMSPGLAASLLGLVSAILILVYYMVTFSDSDVATGMFRPSRPGSFRARLSAMPRACRYVMDVLLIVMLGSMFGYNDSLVWILVLAAVIIEAAVFLRTSRQAHKAKA